jgi:hypothetical protein
VRKSVLIAAAGLLLLGVTLLGSGRGQSQRVAHGHTCSATDRQFIQTAEVNMTALNLWSDDYLHGRTRPAEVVRQAHDAARRVDGMDPSDPSLSKTKLLLNAMFKEYANAIAAKSGHGDPAQHMYRAYGLANFAHDVLVQAEPQLRAKGCEVGTLL